MTLEEFQKIDLSKSVEEFDKIKAFFSQEKLPKADGEEEDWDYGWELIDITDALMRPNNREFFFEFAYLIEAKQPELFKKEFTYFDEERLMTWAFQNKPEKIKEILPHYIEFEPVRQIDNTHKSILQILFYGYNDMLEEYAEKTLDVLDESDEIIGRGDQNRDWKIGLELERVYKEYLESQNFDWESFKNVFALFKVQLNEGFEDNFTEGLTRPLEPLVDLNHLFEGTEEERANCFAILEMLFLRYMFNKNMSFVFSRHIWGNWMIYCWAYREEEEGGTILDPAQFFELKKSKQVRAFYDRVSDSFTNLTISANAILWGGVYVYDFLNSLDIISEEQSAKYISYIKVEKEFVLSNNWRSLWKNSFIHRYVKPDSINEADFEAEKQLFEDSFNWIERPDWVKLDNRSSIRGGLLGNPKFDEFGKDDKGLIWRQAKPIGAKKYGRNEKVSVEYTDGTINENVKYKKIAEDYEKGLCKIIE